MSLGKLGKSKSNSTKRQNYLVTELNAALADDDLIPFPSVAGQVGIEMAPTHELSKMQRRNQNKRHRRKKKKLDQKYLKYSPRRFLDPDTYEFRPLNYFASEARQLESRMGFEGLTPAEMNHIEVTDSSQLETVVGLDDWSHGVFYERRGTCETRDGNCKFVFRKLPRMESIVHKFGKKPKLINEALHEIVMNAPRTVRGNGLGVIRNCINDGKPARYVGIGKVASRGRNSDGTCGGIVQKKTGKVSDQHLQLVESFVMEKHKDCLKEAMGRNLNRVFQKIGKLGNDWSRDKEGLVDVSPSMVIGESPFLCLHDDDDAYLGVISLHCEEDISPDGYYRRDSDVIAYFVFPEYGFRVPLSAGDILVFNPRAKHCLSMPTAEYVSKVYYGCSSYLKSRIAGLNCNAKPFQSDGECDTFTQSQSVSGNDERSSRDSGVDWVYMNMNQYNDSGLRDLEVLLKDATNITAV